MVKKIALLKFGFLIKFNSKKSRRLSPALLCAGRTGKVRSIIPRVLSTPRNLLNLSDQCLLGPAADPIRAHTPSNGRSTCGGPY